MFIVRCRDRNSRFYSYRLFFNKVTGLRPATLLKKRLLHRWFHVNFAKFLRILFCRTSLVDCFCTVFLWNFQVLRITFFTGHLRELLLQSDVWKHFLRGPHIFTSLYLPYRTAVLKNFVKFKKRDL